MSKAQAEKHYPGMRYDEYRTGADLGESIVKNVSLIEHSSGVDHIQMTVPLFIRCLEWAHEDAKDDVELHKFVENIVAKNGVLETDDYEQLLPEEVQLDEAKWETIKSEPATNLKRGDNVYVKLNGHTLRGGKYLQSQDGNGKPGHPKGHLIKWHTSKPGEMTDLNWHAPENVFHDKEPGDIEKVWDRSKKVD